MKVYFDNAASTPLDTKVGAEIDKVNREIFGNPSSIHALGQDARKIIDQSRLSVARILNCDSSEVIFTSGGSEANNLTLRGIIEFCQSKKQIPHLVTSKIEHHSVLHTAEELEKNGLAEVTYLDVNKSGLIKPTEVIASLRDNTVLVSIMYVNNETGAIQPIRKIGKAIEKINQKRDEKKLPRIFFHSDAIQAAGTQKLDVAYLHLDLMSLSAHKIHGPKGSGALYLKSKVPIKPQITGGSQEGGKRAGTENTVGIIGFARALEIVSKKRKANLKKLEELRSYFLAKARKEIPNIRLNGRIGDCSPHIVNLSFQGAEAESILLGLDIEGIAASSGSACTSEILEPSHVLIAMRLKPILAQSSVRFSFSAKNSKKEIDHTIGRLKKIINRLRKISAIK